MIERPQNTVNTMRRSQHDWIEAGLSLLREHGEQSLTIDRLCNTLGVTKGSFYHHFGNLSGYQHALLESWEQQLTSRPIEVAWQEPDPARRAVLLSQTVRELDHRLELAVRAWGLRDQAVRAFVRRVDQRRLEALEEIHRALGHTREDVLARIEYAAFIGAQQLELMPDGHDIEPTLFQGLSLLSNAFKLGSSQDTTKGREHGSQRTRTHPARQRRSGRRTG
jgi:AcrR family transcriptional regulator